MKLRQLRPRVLDDPDIHLDVSETETETESGELGGGGCSSSGRAAPRNPRLAVYGRGLDDIAEFFNSGSYSPGEKKSEGRRKLFTREEKFLLNKRVPNLADATSEKWLPLHTLAASGEFYLVDALLKHNVDINAADKDGLTALHRAILCKKQAVTNYLLRESANPFVRDKEGATLMHYAVQTASIPAIKTLLLYNVDINLADDYGWTPLHLAVLTRRTDLVKLLLIKGADKTQRNKNTRSIAQNSLNQISENHPYVSPAIGRFNPSRAVPLFRSAHENLRTRQVIKGAAQVTAAQAVNWAPHWQNSKNRIEGKGEEEALTNTSCRRSVDGSEPAQHGMARTKTTSSGETSAPNCKLPGRRAQTASYRKSKELGRKAKDVD
ncbi:hypothetical protein Scep_020114 [Stephania cephalantha]|uniref:Uncharacterized protein n=1 Tax=Stephania cephalantha TaxID=152367 RepID=A0AAP0IC71_9MAGN